MLLLRIWIGVTIALSIAAMKWSSLRMGGLAPTETRSMIWSPVFSVPSWKKRRRVDSLQLRSAVVRLFAFAVMLVASWWAYWTWIPALRPSAVAQGYLAIVPFYILFQFLSLLLELMWWPSGWHYPAHIDFPVAAQGVDEFWGRRWATWIADWTRQMIFVRFRRRPVVGLLAVFGVSSLWHELMLDVPFYVFYGVNLVGDWLVYFAIQAVGVVGERLLFRRRSALSWLYAWAVIVLPAPFALNRATLSAIGLFIG